LWIASRLVCTFAVNISEKLFGCLQYVVMKTFCCSVIFHGVHSIVEPDVDVECVFNLGFLVVLISETSTWSQPMYMNACTLTARAAHTMCSIGGKLVIFGGRDSESRTNDLHFYDTSRCTILLLLRAAVRHTSTDAIWLVSVWLSDEFVGQLTPLKW
jgi:Galactose oxidase, central domain